MSARPPTPHDFLLHLRTHAPPLARRLDGITSLERAGGELRVRVPAGGWAHRELLESRSELGGAARRFFGPGVTVSVLTGPEDPEALPFPVMASKVWNHVAFWVWDHSASGALVVRKPRYRDAWLPAAGVGEEALEPLAEPEVSWLSEALPGAGAGAEAVLPNLLDRLGELARAASSYAHLVTAFPGDEAADLLEARLYAVKEWGTPGTPAPLLQKYVGRLHYVDPKRPPMGPRLARRLLSPAASHP